MPVLLSRRLQEACTGKLSVVVGARLVSPRQHELEVCPPNPVCFGICNTTTIRDGREPLGFSGMNACFLCLLLVFASYASSVLLSGRVWSVQVP